MARTERQCGLSKLEFLLVLAVIAVLLLVALEQMKEVQELSEEMVVEATLRNISSGLRYAMAEDIIHGTEGRIAERVGGNPVRWLDQPPAGYLGEFPATPEPLPAGAWVFDSTRRELCYRPKLFKHLVIAGDGQLLRWRIESVAASPASARVSAVRVAAVQVYSWF